VAEHRTDLRVGLTSEEAARRLAEVGPNELHAAPPVTVWRRLARQFTDPLVLLLLAAIAISLLAWLSDGGGGAPLEAIVIAAIVVVNAVIGTWQEDRAIKAVAALRRLAGTHATVVRDGRTQPIASGDLVPGDVLVMAQGDAVGADCRVVEAASLAVAEAALTGESTPVYKSVAAVPEDTVLPERSSMAYQGTAVTLGRGVGIVVATGMHSEIGRIAELIDTADTERTPLQRQIEWLGRSLGAIVIVLAAIVVGTVVSTSDVSTFADYVEATLIGVSLAVAAVPEGLPAILTIVLALGVQRMASKRAIVKRLSSVETLGAAAVICTDKTGTLTRNEMSIVTVVVPSGRAVLTGVGYDPIGELSTGDGQAASDALAAEVERVIAAGSIANDASLHLSEAGRWEVRGDPTEIAFLVAEQKLGLRERRADGHRRIDEIPFDSDRKLMTTVNEASESVGFSGHDSELVMFTKGAPDVLIERCTSERIGSTIRPLTPEARRAMLAEVDRLADEALRPLAVAYRPVRPDHTSSSDPESGLILLGVVGIVDPPRAEAGRSVAEAIQGGIRVIMITGDHPRTAARIADQLGLANPRPVLTGADLDAMDDEALALAVTTTDVFARVDPSHKLRLVRSLQAHGLVTAMTGDGVNDAPALKQADIGVAMGVNGTEVAKEAADMIIADDDFATILRAVREGREIFSDIRKFLRYLLTSNTGEVLVVFVGVLLGSQLGLVDGVGELGVPLLATQILWINLVTDGALALALGVDPAVEDVMAQRPRAVGARVVDGPMLRTIAVVGVVIAAAGLAALDLGLTGGWLGGSGDIRSARTMAFTTVVLAQVCNAFTSRSDSVSVVHGLFTNRLLWGAALITVVAQVAVVHLPGLSSAFDTVPLTATEWLVCSALAGTVLVASEATKAVVRRRAPC
jgi:potassium/sodium efflux P-type ATPase